MNKRIKTLVKAIRSFQECLCKLQYSEEETLSYNEKQAAILECQRHIRGALIALVHEIELECEKRGAKLAS